MTIGGAFFDRDGLAIYAALAQALPEGVPIHHWLRRTLMKESDHTGSQLRVHRE